jgi:selenocysteine lyase/cysteine desulfurase
MGDSLSAKKPVESGWWYQGRIWIDDRQPCSKTHLAARRSCQQRVVQWIAVCNREGLTAFQEDVMVRDSAVLESGLSRRQFAKSIGAGSIAALLSRAEGHARPGPLPPAPDSPNESFWSSVREQFLMPPDLGVMNAANLCPSSAAVVDSLLRNTKDMDRDPSFPNRVKMGEGKEGTRRVVAEFLRVTPEEIVLTRNTSEANNLVSSGIDLRPGDEVLLFSDNHPSNLEAWKIKAKRFGYTVKVVEHVNPHPGAEFYVEAFGKQMTGRTKVVGFTHLTSTVGDLFPAKELCRLARERGALTLVDGAQSLGLIDVDLSDMQPDFYSGSAHKWPCGPKEVGVLYINKAAQDKIWPSLVSAFPGAVGISKTFESFGQRDEPAIIAFGEALRLQMKIGRKVIQGRAQELTQALIAGLGKMDNVKVWTSQDSSRSVAVVSFRPDNLDIPRLAAALYEKDRVAGAPRLGADRGGLRFSPHFYNLHSEVERALAAIQRYVKSGV